MEGREWVSLGGVGHVELSEGFFGLTVNLSVDYGLHLVKLDSLIQFEWPL